MRRRKPASGETKTQPSAGARRGSVRVKPEPKEESGFWTDVDRRAAEIGARWPTQVSAVDAMREGRREL